MKTRERNKDVISVEIIIGHNNAVEERCIH